MQNNVFILLYGTKSFFMSLHLLKKSLFFWIYVIRPIFLVYTFTAERVARVLAPNPFLIYLQSILTQIWKNSQLIQLPFLGV